MGAYVLIRPEDDARAEQVSEWADALSSGRGFSRHTCAGDVRARTPADVSQILGALQQPASLILYFGHGDERSWTTSDVATVTVRNVQAAVGKAVVSIACRTSVRLGPSAVAKKKGVRSWLGFTIDFPVPAPYRYADVFGESMVRALDRLGRGDSMRETRDAISNEFDSLVTDFGKGGRRRRDYNAQNYYYSAMAVRDKCVVHGSKVYRPLP